MGKYEVTEWCPHCESEITMTWDVQSMGYKAFCPVCGERLMLCDECQHSGPNGEYTDRCNYDSKTDTRHLRRIKLWEVSIVTWAMNEQARIDEVKSMVECLKSEVKSGKITRARLDALKPFIAVVRELADILSPFLEPPMLDDASVQNESPTQNNVKQIKKSGIVFEIIPQLKQEVVKK